ncbi:hypothetical protein QF032_007759 [Streptomyces achromogenes]|nr:hypothetical protein [Streptomyces achromogenes]
MTASRVRWLMAWARAQAARSSVAGWSRMCGVVTSRERLDRRVSICPSSVSVMRSGSRKWACRRLCSTRKAQVSLGQINRAEETAAAAGAARAQLGEHPPPGPVEDDRHVRPRTAAVPGGGVAARPQPQHTAGREAVAGRHTADQRCGQLPGQRHGPQHPRCHATPSMPSPAPAPAQCQPHTRPTASLRPLPGWLVCGGTAGFAGRLHKARGHRLSRPRSSSHRRPPAQTAHRRRRAGGGGGTRPRPIPRRRSGRRAGRMTRLAGLPAVPAGWSAAPWVSVVALIQ